MDGEIEALKGETGWLDQLQVLHRMDIGTLRGKLDEFRLHCKADGREGHCSLSDAKRHFNNWLRIAAAKDNGDDRNRTGQANRRGSLEVAATGEEDYKTSF